MCPDGGDASHAGAADRAIEQDVLFETRNRFHGGERNVMSMNATVSDGNYIAAEDEFLLTENRINVSST